MEKTIVAAFEVTFLKVFPLIFPYLFPDVSHFLAVVAPFTSIALRAVWVTDFEEAHN